MSPTKPRIVIVGAGPTGLSLAVLLRLRGYAPLIVERNASVEHLPAAHVVNKRSMEILHEIGVPRQYFEYSPDRPVPDPGNWRVTWCETLAGTEYGALTMRQKGHTTASAFAGVNVAQNLLSRFLLERLRELGGDVVLNCALGALNVDGDEVHYTLRGPDQTLTHSTADFLIGCDGAGSTVRRAIGVEMEGPASLARFLTVYFQADLDRYVSHRRGPLYLIAGPQVRCTLISYDMDRLWAMLFSTGDHPREAYSTEIALSLVRRAVGEPDLPLDLIGIGSWNMSAQVASTYRKGNVFLAGDACHRFPPTGGLGMNTGIQDAHNLAWKLDFVLRGLARPALLNTYEGERRPIARANTDASVFNLRHLQTISSALGFDFRAPTPPVDPAAPFLTFPPDLLGMAGDSPAAKAKRHAVQVAIDQQAPHYGAAVGRDVGFSYEGVGPLAVCPDGSQPPSPDGVAFEPDAHPGARLPFFRLADGRSVHDALLRDRYSLLASDPVWRGCESTWLGVRLFGWDLPALRDEGRGLLGIEDSGAVLVRPDGHVAWRVREAPADAKRALATAMRTLALH